MPTTGTRIDVPHPTLKAGDPCPACPEGILYEKVAGVLVRITGQPPLTATVYELQKLRCHSCGEVFTAPPLTRTAERKYDATAGSMIALLKYGSGLPFNRLAGLQGHLEILLCRHLHPVGCRGGGGAVADALLRGTGSPGGAGRGAAQR